MLKYTNEQKIQGYDMICLLLHKEVSNTKLLMELYPDDFDVAQYGVILLTALGLTLNNVEQVDPTSKWLD